MNKRFKLIESAVTKIVKRVLTEARIPEGTLLRFVKSSSDPYGVVVKSKYSHMIAWQSANEEGDIVSGNVNMLNQDFFDSLVSDGQIRIVKQGQ